MVMSRDRRGLAVLVDALIFLTVLSVLSAFLLVPSATSELGEKDHLVRSFHSVMLGGEVPGDDGSALSRLSLSSFLAVAAQDRVISSIELGRIGSAVSGALTELKNMGQRAWWVLSLDGEEMEFGDVCDDTSASLYADRRNLSADGTLFCLLVIAV